MRRRPPGISPIDTPLGATFEVDVVASRTLSISMTYQFDLVFDPTKLQFVDGAFEGAFLSTAGPTFFFEGIWLPGQHPVRVRFPHWSGTGCFGWWRIGAL